MSQSAANQSLKRDSLLTGKRTGNFTILGLFPARQSKKLFVIQEVTNEFPKRQNREIIRWIWELFSREQGIIIAECGAARNAAVLSALAGLHRRDSS